MPLTKLQFRPGIIRETTEYSNSGGWYDGDKVRFRQGFPEKIGGWLRVVQQKLAGVCRHLHQWSTVESDRYVGLGTSSHLYILWSENFYDMTPIRSTAGPLAANPFTTGTAGSTTLTINVPSSGALAGDYINITGATGFDAFTAAQLNTQFEITAVNGSLLSITMPVGAIGNNVTGGGSAVKVAFLIQSGSDDAAVGEGWGVPPWGGSAPGAGMSSGWGQPFDPSLLNPADPTVNQLRLWDIDNFGDDMVANIRSGAIYYWHQALGLTSPAVPLTQTITVGSVTFTPKDAPVVANQVIVSPNDRHLIAFGCNDVGQTEANLMLVRWSDAEDAYTWTPLRTNSAGSQPLSGASYIICAMRTAANILIWTDLGMWTMTYIGMPYVFGFQPIAEGLSIIGPNAMINTGSIVLWMDRGIFYAYTGQVQELPCSVKDYVFKDFNFLQGYKVYAGHNHSFSEVFWFYPSASSQENDSYVIYNYGEQTWSIGKLERTSWLDMGRASYPIATDRANSFLYYHNYGDDADGQPLPAWIESADIDASGGDHFLFMSRVIPDVIFRGTAPAQDQSAGITILTRSGPGKPKQTVADLTVNAHTGLEFVRLRDRQISFRISSSGPGVGWRLGTLRTDLQPDGQK